MDCVKRCFKCGEEKPIEQFHLHAMMADGHLNKCKACSRKDDTAYRIKRWGSLRAFRRASYERELVLGTRSRVAPQKYGRDPVARKAATLRYFHKRRARINMPMSELDRFVFDEAIRLCAQRGAATGIAWSLDHVVPLHHKDACGLHVAANLQVAPRRWNEMKKNRTMIAFFPLRGMGM
jgi:hypothetical protein